jgi:hypothetical protein
MVDGQSGQIERSSALRGSIPLIGPQRRSWLGILRAKSGPGVDDERSPVWAVGRYSSPTFSSE